jgi:asparagine synthase (glutamine-hydrolysing)
VWNAIHLDARWLERIEWRAEILQVATPDEVYRRMHSHWPQPYKVVQNAGGYAATVNGVGGPSFPTFTERMMFLDSLTYLPDDILVKVDRASMAVSLEVRVPFLDHRVFELAWRLPLKLKQRDAAGKWVLREILYRYVPRDLVDQPKSGFSVPIGAWLRGPLKDWAHDLLAGPPAA